MPMNINLNPTPTASTITPSPTTTTPTLDSDTDTPPPPSPPQPKRVPLSRHHAPPCTAVVVVSYKECLKNHAASIGGHALDGCCEFLPGPTFDPLDPTSLKCAACGCHRNFHRRDPDDPTPLHHRHPVARVPHSPPRAWQNGNHTSRKRSRTKFSPRQKEKMLEFSEKIGWKLKKGENKLVEEFCKEIGVERGVFKVWMHNNKHSYSSLRREKERNLLHNLSNGSCGGGVNQFCGNGSKKQEII